MKLSKVGLFAVLALAITFALSGCFKKKEDVHLADATGFETTNTEELAQLPQSTTSSNQQSGVEVLPIETAPVTQGAGATLATPVANEAAVQTAAASSATLSQNQKIQTALKNAGLYSGKIDGKIGPGSKKAIEAFQKQQGLKADGKVGPKTWAALEPFVNGASTAAQGSADTTTGATQE